MACSTLGLVFALSACNSAGTNLTVPPAPVSSGSFEVVYMFPGSDGTAIHPAAPLFGHDGILYGTGSETKHTTIFSRCCGNIYKVSGNTIDVVHNFTRNDGAHPQTPMIWYDGRLWGTTSNGGVGCSPQGCGTVFGVDPKTGKDVEYYSFKGGAGDGAYPYGGLVAYNGMLYGTTLNAGANSCGLHGCGTIFQLNPATGAEKIVHNFDGVDGAYPYAGLTLFEGKLYGTTANGGYCGGLGCGVLFSFDPTTAKYTPLHLFAGHGTHSRDGDNPRSSVVVWNNSLLGTTVNGGAANVGTLYQYTPATKAYKRFSLKGGEKNSAYPFAQLFVHNGWAYGTAASGGPESNICPPTGCGTVFKWNPTTDDFEVMQAFDGKNGRQPRAGLELHSGFLWSTTWEGGDGTCTFGCGVIFKIKP